MNKVSGIVVGQYGTAITLQVVDDDGLVVDLSSYTDLTVRATSDDEQEVFSSTGVLVGGGSGGQFSFTPSSGNTFGRPGTWDAQVQFTATGILDLTIPFELVVERQI